MQSAGILPVVYLQAFAFDSSASGKRVCECDRGRVPGDLLKLGSEGEEANGADGIATREISHEGVKLAEVLGLDEDENLEES